MALVNARRLRTVRTAANKGDVIAAAGREQWRSPRDIAREPGLLQVREHEEIIDK
jgi:hypothetical protein